MRRAFAWAERINGMKSPDRRNGLFERSALARKDSI
jgi:hypothetical protein